MRYAALALLLAAVPLPSESEKWLTLRLGELRIYSNADQAQTQKIAGELVKLRAALGKGIGLTVRPGLPMRVVIFRDEKTFGPIRDTILDRPASGIRGVFFGGQNGSYALIGADSESGIDRVVYRKVARHLVLHSAPALPHWLSEGLAEYYSTFTARGNDVYAGALIPAFVNALRGQTLMPLRRMFAGEDNALFPAHAWALVHYLLNGNDTRRDQMPKFIELLSAGKPAEEAFRTAFQAGYEDIDRELKQYVARLVFGFRKYPSSDLQLPAVPQAGPAARDEVLYTLGDLLAHSGPRTREAAEEFLREAVRVNPRSAQAHATLGVLHEARKQPGEADAAYQKAIEFGSAEADVYIPYGGAMLDRGDARARDMFVRATELDPAAPRAWAGLGATYAGNESDLSAGIAALEKSLSIAGAQQDVAFNLVQLYARSGRGAEARRLFETVLARSGNAELVGRARENLLVADVMDAEALLNRGQVQESAAILRNAQKTTTNERLKSHVSTLLVEVDRQLAFQKHAAVYDAAVEKASEGKYAEALAMVDEILPQIADKDLRGMVQRFRGDVARKIKK